MKITLYPGGHNYEQVYLDGEVEMERPIFVFTGRREGCFTDRVRIVTTVPYLIETVPPPKTINQESAGLSFNTYGLEPGRDWEYIG